MPKFRKKPAPIQEARQVPLPPAQRDVKEWLAYVEKLIDLARWCNGEVRFYYSVVSPGADSEATGILLNHRRDVRFAAPGDWIVKQEENWHRVVRPDIFHETYEEVKEK